MQKNSTQSGFTLIELLVVIAIIGLLGSIALTNLAASRVKARDARRKTDLVQLQKALELYYNVNGAYPLTNVDPAVVWRGVPDCTDTSPDTTYTGADGYIPSLAPTYVSVLPKDPKPANVACTGYLYRSDGINYKILSHSSSGVGGPETFPTVGQPFYDPTRPTWAMMVTNNPSVTNAW